MPEDSHQLDSLERRSSWETTLNNEADFLDLLPNRIDKAIIDAAATRVVE